MLMTFYQICLLKQDDQCTVNKFIMVIPELGHWLFIFARGRTFEFCLPREVSNTAYFITILVSYRSWLTTKTCCSILKEDEEMNI